METQCLAIGGPLAVLDVKVRCLRLVNRAVGYQADGEFVPASSIQIDGRTYDSWQEASECEMRLPAFRFAELEAGPVHQRFIHPPTNAVESIRDASGAVAGAIVRTQEPFECSVQASLEQPQVGVFRIKVRISNDTPLTAWPPANREAVLGRSLLSAHTVLQLTNAEFVSLLEPPPEFQEAAVACRNTGTWPVLAGEEGRRDTMLSSPIILYDYPQVAPESPGDLFDGAEIDEILSLRILALTDAEKDAMRRSDERARRILERTETLPAEHFMKLHGALRGLHPEGKVPS
jgi:hydrogenase maturation protease